MLQKLINALKKKPTIILYAAGVVLLVAGGLLWCFKVSMSPERVFWGTVEQSLSTRSVTIQANQSGQGSSLKQTTQFSLGVNNITHTLTRVKQGDVVVVNELVGTPTNDYTRYVSVKTDQKGKNGKPLDFSKIVGVWAKSDDGSAQLFSQGVLGGGLPLGGVAVPIGNLNTDARAKLVKSIKNDVVYQVDFDKVKSKRENGRLLYVYDVAVQPVSYVSMMQNFAKSLGLHDLDSLDPAQYKGQKATNMRLVIDARAHHVVEASINNGTTSASQTYTSYDIVSSFAVPKKAITAAELQKRLSSLE